MLRHKIEIANVNTLKKIVKFRLLIKIILNLIKYSDFNKKSL